MTSEDILGLVLRRLKSSDRQQQLCPTFLLVPACVYVWFDSALDFLYHTPLRSDNVDFRCAWPTVEEIDESSAPVHANREYGHLFKGFFAVVDGGQFPCADYVNDDVQNAYYEGHTCSVEITNLLEYNFKGEIIHAVINNPRFCHDSSLAYKSGQIFPQLSDDMPPLGRTILGDSAFSARGIEGKTV